MISIVGGAGFLGTYLAKRLDEIGVDFEILDIHNSKCFPNKSKIVNLNDFEDLKAALD